MMRVAIIGAGIGGVSLAHALRAEASVSVFEKGRGVGGRMATRREGKHAFDHGAQCFTVRTPQFQEWLEPLRHAGLVAEWTGPVVNLSCGRVTGPRHWHERHLVGVPGMNAIARQLARGLDVRTSVEVAPIRLGNGPVRLATVDGEELGVFDLVVSTTTARQTHALFEGVTALPALSRAHEAVPRAHGGARSTVARGVDRSKGHGRADQVDFGRQQQAGPGREHGADRGSYA